MSTEPQRREGGEAEPTTLRRRGRIVGACTYPDPIGSFPSWWWFLHELSPGERSDAIGEALKALVHEGEQGRIGKAFYEAFAAASQDEVIDPDVVFPADPADFDAFDRAMAVFKGLHLSPVEFVRVVGSARPVEFTRAVVDALEKRRG